MTILKTEDNIYLEIIGGNIRNCFSKNKEPLNIVNFAKLEIEYKENLIYIKETIKETFQKYNSEKEILKNLSKAFNKNIFIEKMDLKTA